LTFETLKRVPKVRLSLTAHLTLSITQLQSEGLLCTLEWPSVAIAGTGVTQHMPIALKALSVRSVVALTELRTTGSWLGVARLTLSLTLLERLLQLVHPVLTLSSV